MSSGRKYSCLTSEEVLAQLTPSRRAPLPRSFSFHPPALNALRVKRPTRRIEPLQETNVAISPTAESQRDSATKPRVARPSQPWALGRNPFGILVTSDWKVRAPITHGTASRKLSPPRFGAFA